MPHFVTWNQTNEEMKTFTESQTRRKCFICKIKVVLKENKLFMYVCMYIFELKCIFY